MKLIERMRSVLVVLPWRRTPRSGGLAAGSVAARSQPARSAGSSLAVSAAKLLKDFLAAIAFVAVNALTHDMSVARASPSRSRSCSSE